MDDKHHSRWVRRTAVSKRGLKEALVVVEANVVGAFSIDSETGQKTCDEGHILSSL